MHGISPDDVHFHEVGALDAIADVVGVGAGLDAPRARPARRLARSRWAAARPAARTASCRCPARRCWAAGRASRSSPGRCRAELCTPTGAALLAQPGDEWTALPAMPVRARRRRRRRPRPGRAANVVRLVVGEPAPGATGRAGGPVVLEANVDDLDPRLWPGVLAALLAAGASDAWLTPILMKKGRPAHTLSVLCRPEAVPAVHAAVFAATSTIGLRVLPVGKVALDRAQATVDVLGGRCASRWPSHGGRVVNVSVEYEDVAALARGAGVPVKEVLRAATAAAEAAYPVSPRSRPLGQPALRLLGETSSTRVMTAQRWPNGS